MVTLHPFGAGQLGKHLLLDAVPTHESALVRNAPVLTLNLLFVVGEVALGLIVTPI